MSNREYRLKYDVELGTASQASTTLETDTSSAGENRIVPYPVGRQLRSVTAQTDTSHVDCVISQLGDHLSAKQKATVNDFVRKNADVFSASEFDLGRTDLLQHSIELNSTKPVRQALRRHPVAYLPLIDQYVGEMVEHGIIEPMPGSEWVANIVLVGKKDGNLRYCVDYRGLNTITQKRNYPLPRIDTCLESLGNNCLFTSLDMRSGYWQVPVKPEDRAKTCFVTRKGIFGFNVLPFGLCNAPSTFQRLVDMALAGLTLEVCLIYLDDLVVFSRTFEDHVVRLQAVFDRLRTANLKLKPSKCVLFAAKIKFLGSVISEEGIAPDPHKVEAVKTWPVPKNLTETRAFVTLAGYYRKHIRDFSLITPPLHKLTRKDMPFVWGSSQDQAFNKLKECLTTAPVLAMPIDGGDFVLDTDANASSAGCVLQR